MAYHRTPARVVAIALLGALSVSPLSSQSVFSRGEKPFASISRLFLRESARDSLVELATSQVGTRYVWGAATPGTAFDCSGLVQWLMANFNLTLPRTSRDQAQQGLEIPKDPEVMLPGDLLYFARGSRVDHVGIYIGEGRYVHAANRRKGVVVSNLPTGRSRDTWWRGVRRLFTHPEDVLSITEQLPIGT